MSESTTRAPLRASSFPIASPRPDPPPVTIATLPSNPLMARLLSAAPGLHDPVFWWAGVQYPCWDRFSGGHRQQPHGRGPASRWRRRRRLLQTAEADLVEEERAEGAALLAGEPAGEHVVDDGALHSLQTDVEHRRRAAALGSAVDEAGPPHGEAAGIARRPDEVDARVAEVGGVAAGQRGAGQEAGAGELEATGAAVEVIVEVGDIDEPGVVEVT